MLLWQKEGLRMPLYEYRCQDCGNLLTIRQSFSDDSVPSCPACGDRQMKRIISSVSVVKTEQERASDLSWVDKNLAGRIRKKASRQLGPALQEAVERMESQ
jgi:putative FmdB family regulatory protein